MSSSTRTPTLVGRAHELAILRAALDCALSGQPRVVVLVGEPGIGKTRTVQALSDLAAHKGVATLWGRCHQGPEAPAFWPWVQVLRRWADSLDDQALSAALGSAASYVAQVHPELRGRLPRLPAPEPLADAGQARFRLFDAVSEFWKRASAVQPLLLVFEDLHWADIPSLRLLEFVAGDSAASRILLVGTARDTELSAEHPFVSALAELQRKTVVQRLALTGLTIEETALLIELVAGSKPPDATTALVQAKTGGNPLFVGEMARYLANERLLTTAGCSPGFDSWRVPDGIRAFVGTRLNRLSAEARSVLRRAAVIGTRFSFGLLHRVTEDLPAERVLTLLDEAASTHIIEDGSEPGWFQFGHVLIRDTVYEEMSSLERARLHERIGTALEDDHRHDVALYVAILAHHFTAALPAGSGAKAVEYATRAGEQARTRLAHEEAARWFSLALNALDQTVPPDAGQRCRLVIALGSVQLRSGHTVQALETLTEAASRASHLGAAKDLMQAAIEFEEVTWRLGLSGLGAVRLLETSLRHLDEGDGIARARLQSSLVRGLVFAGRPDEALRLHQEAVALARRVGDAETLEAALRSGFWLRWDPGELEALLATAHETIALARQIGNRERVLDAAAFRLHLLIAVGDFGGFSSDLDEFAQLADELRQPFHRYHATVMRAAQALFVGRFVDAERFARGAEALGRRLPGLDASGAFGMQMFALAQERGELPQLAPMVAQFVHTTPGSATWRPAVVLVQVELGQLQEARAALEQLAPANFRAVPRDSLWLACLAYLAQACAILRDRTHADTLYALLAPWRGRNLVAASMVVSYGPADRFLGMLCTVLKRWDTAARHFDAAIEMSRRQGSTPWLAHAQHDYASMLLERGQQGDAERARTLLAGALQLAESLGMTRLKEAVAQLALALESRPPQPSYPGGLSRREAQVLRMIAAGKSNQEIATAIFRSPSTVASHVRSILAKLGAANRTEAATFAARHGLV